MYRGDIDLKRKLFNNASPIADSLNSTLDILFDKHFGEVGIATYSFLREPFYRITHDMCIRDSIFWCAIQDEYGDDPYQPYVELYKVYAQPAWNSKEKQMFVFVEQEI